MNHSTKQTVWNKAGDHPKVWEDYASDCGGDTPNGVYYLGTTNDLIEVLPGDVIHDMDDGTALVAGPMTKRRGYGRRPWYNRVTNTTDTEPDMNSMSTMKRSDVAPQSFAAAEPVQRVPQQVDSLRQDIENLSQDLYKLETRIDSVMTPLYAEDTAKPMREGEGPDTGPSSQLAHTLESFGAQVRAIRRRVSEMTDRVEV